MSTTGTTSKTSTALQDAIGRSPVPERDDRRRAVPVRTLSVVLFQLAEKALFAVLKQTEATVVVRLGRGPLALPRRRVVVLRVRLAAQQEAHVTVAAAAVAVDAVAVPTGGTRLVPVAASFPKGSVPTTGDVSDAFSDGLEQGEQGFGIRSGRYLDPGDGSRRR